MSVFKKFPLTLAACLALCLLAANASAQSGSDFSRPRQVVQALTPDGSPRLETDVYLVSEAPAASAEMPKPAGLPNRTFQLNHLLMTAIERRLGARYVYGATGPYVFDCSGFVWSVFQSAGVSFDRMNARTLWAQFEPARDEERYKFGTLVFFNNLKHVGIVADENGFYHASSSHGVQYSTFDGYWGERIVGFRRIPLPAQLTAE